MICVKFNGVYINLMLVFQEVIFGGVDEVMMFDLEGYVVEGFGENIFIIKDGVIYILEVIVCLNGIICNIILILVVEYGFKLVEKCIICDEVYIVDEVFFIGIVVEVMLICEVDGCKIGVGCCGLVIEKLQKVYFDLVSGKIEVYVEWCILVK